MPRPPQTRNLGEDDDGHYHDIARDVELPEDVRLGKRVEASPAWQLLARCLPRRKGAPGASLQVLPSLLCGKSGSPETYVFTGEDGTVRKGGERRLSMKRIARDFASLAGEGRKIVAVEHAAGGEYIPVSSERLLALSRSGGLSPGIVCLQPYLGSMRDESGDDSKPLFNYRCQYWVDETGGGAVCVGAGVRLTTADVTGRGGNMPGIVVSRSTALNAAMGKAARAAAAAMEQAMRCRVMRLELDFCQDEAGDLWLAGAPSAKWVPNIPNIDRPSSPIPMELISSQRAMERRTREFVSAGEDEGALAAADLEASLAHEALGSTQLQGCRGDFCKYDVGRRLRNETQAAEFFEMGSNQANGNVSQQRKRLLGMGLAHISDEDIIDSGVSLRGRGPQAPVEEFQTLPLKAIVQARREKVLVDTFLRRYAKGEDAPYLQGEGGEESKLSSRFPGALYAPVRVCSNCFQVYGLLERSRSAALSRLHRQPHQVVTSPVRRKRATALPANSKAPQVTVVDEDGHEHSPEAISLSAARQAMGSLSKKDVAELRSFANPHQSVVRITGAAVLLLTGRQLAWDGCRRTLSMGGGNAFLAMLRRFDPCEADERIIQKVRSVADIQELSPHVLRGVSEAAAKLSEWVRGVIQTRQWMMGTGHPTLNLVNEIPIRNTRPPPPRRHHPLAPARSKGKRSTTPPTSESALLVSAGRRFTCSDGTTQLPYMVIGRPLVAGAPCEACNFVIVHDFFDSLEGTEALFAPVLRRVNGCQALLWNYPGQASTSCADGCSYENRSLAPMLHELMQHVHYRGEMNLNLPFHLLGIGNGVPTAASFCRSYSKHPLYSASLRSLVSINGFAGVDAQLAAVLHSSDKVFGSLPSDRPDLPVSYFSNYLFSDGYLSRVDRDLALGIHTAVSNPISLEGRRIIVRSALNHEDLRKVVGAGEDGLLLPIILLQSTENLLVDASNVDPFVRGRSVTHVWSHEMRPSAGGARVLGIGGPTALVRALSSRNGALVAWVRAGHEVRQEMKPVIEGIIEALAVPTPEALGVKDRDISTLPEDAIIGLYPQPQSPHLFSSEPLLHDTAIDTTVARVSLDKTDGDGKKVIRKRTLANSSRSLQPGETGPPAFPESAAVSRLSQGGQQTRKHSSSRMQHPASTVKGRGVLGASTSPISRPVRKVRDPSAFEKDGKNFMITGGLAAVENVALATTLVEEWGDSHSPAGAQSTQKATEGRLDTELAASASDNYVTTERDSTLEDLDRRGYAVSDEVQRQNRRWREDNERGPDELHQAQLRLEKNMAELRKSNAEARREQERIVEGLGQSLELEQTQRLQQYQEEDIELISRDLETTALEEGEIGMDTAAERISPSEAPEGPSLESDLEAELSAVRRELIAAAAQQAVEFDELESSLVDADLAPNYDPPGTLPEPTPSMRPMEYSDPVELPDVITRKHNIDSLFAANAEDERAAKERGMALIEFQELQAREAARAAVQAANLIAVAKADRESAEAHLAVRIQAVVRGAAGRARARALHNVRNSDRQKQKAALVLQCLVRGFLGRVEARRRRRAIVDEAVLGGGATTLQAAWRGHLGRKIARERRRLKACATVQRVYRGHVGRGVARKLRERLFLLRQRQYCASLVQSLWRGHAARKSFMETRVGNSAATEIQRVFRGMVGRRAVARRRQWQEAKPGPERIKLGLELIEDSRLIFERQRAEIDALQRASERAEQRTSELHNELRASEADLRVLEQELESIDHLEGELKQLTHERDLAQRGIVGAAGYGADACGDSKASPDANPRLAAQKAAYALEVQIQIKRAEREKKRQILEAEFEGVFREVASKKADIARLHDALAGMESVRARKERLFQRLQRNLMQLLHEQKAEVDALREQGEKLEVAQATTAAAASAAAQRAREHEAQAETMFSQTEELMKFQFMSVSLSYFSSLNMMQRMRDINADTTTAAVVSSADAARAAAAAAKAAGLPRGAAFPGVDDELEQKQLILAAEEKDLQLAKASTKRQFANDVREWSVEDVGFWLESLGFSQYKAAFAEALVDGQFLVALEPKDCMDVLGVEHKLHIKKLFLGIDKLRPLNESELSQKQSMQEEASAASWRTLEEVPDIELVLSQVRNGRLKRLEESLNKGFLVDAEDAHGNTALLVSCQNMHQPICELLLRRGANINHTNAAGNTALHYAMSYDPTGALGEFLIEKGADDTIENKRGLSCYDGLE